MIIMLEPALLKSLKLLRETEESLTSKDITEKIREARDYVEKALEKLVERDIVAKGGELYSYRNTLANEKLFEKISLVYGKVIKRPQIESLVVGLLCTTTQHKHSLRLKTLLGVMEEEGFDSKEVNNFLEEETENGRVGRFRIALGTRKEALLPVPPVSPFYYLSHFRQLEPNEYERLKKEWLDSGFFIREEDYLIANFPDEIANRAKEYLNREASRIRDRLREETLDFWVRYVWCCWAGFFSTSFPLELCMSGERSRLWHL